MTEAGAVETTEVKDVHRLDEAQLGKYLAAQIDGFDPRLTIRQFPSGQSNPTYQIESGGRRYVLRKKPPGVLLPSAHAVDREYKVIKALQGSDVPVPAALHLCQDPDILGTDFFVMEMVEGRVFPDPALPGLDPADRTQFFDNFIRILAALHSVDIEAAGLAEFGRASGYLERQVSRWGKQYEASKTEDIDAMDQLTDWLPKNAPQDQSVSVVHGDYRPGNVIVAPNGPGIVAVLDWELSTLGHPLADVGYCCASYNIQISAQGDFSNLDHAAMGIPSQQEFVDRYCHYSGREDIPDFHYYVVFSLFRSAAIIQGVYKRGLDGNAASEEALKFGGLARSRAEAAWKIIEDNY
jgi:aminoglycoside phosphotransferase (APT) family kinase protein